MNSRRILALCFGLLAGLSAYAFHDRYWIYRNKFNDLGRYYEPGEQIVYLEQSGMIWGGAALLLFAFALVLWPSRRQTPPDRDLF